MNRPRSLPAETAVRYLVAVVSVATVSTLSVSFRAQLQPHTYPLYLFAIVVTAFLAGLEPALLAIFLSVVATNYIEYRQIGRVEIDANDAIQLAILVGTAVIITIVVAQRKRAEAALERANDELRELDRAKDQLIASVSHELRTPTTVILGWAQVLRIDATPELVSNALPAIESAARAQSRLIEDLLDMSRLILGKMRLEIQPTALNTVVRNAVEMARPAAEERGILLYASLPGALFVEADATRLQQVCWNLLSNALKFTPRDGRIDVALARRDTQAEISVTDSGEGISADLLPHLFEPLRQGSSGVKGGLGLGLAIAHQLVAMHGGTIEASSAGKGKGARFTVRLPLTSVQPS